MKSDSWFIYKTPNSHVRPSIQVSNIQAFDQRLMNIKIIKWCIKRNITGINNYERWWYGGIRVYSFPILDPALRPATMYPHYDYNQAFLRTLELAWMSLPRGTAWRFHAHFVFSSFSLTNCPEENQRLLVVFLSETIKEKQVNIQKNNKLFLKERIISLHFSSVDYKVFAETFAMFVWLKNFKCDYHFSWSF